MAEEKREPENSTGKTEDFPEKEKSTSERVREENSSKMEKLEEKLVPERENSENFPTEVQGFDDGERRSLTSRDSSPKIEVEKKRAHFQEEKPEGKLARENLAKLELSGKKSGGAWVFRLRGCFIYIF